ncbi:MAG: MarR family transcriptional regulator [Actinobacteria bacterium]|uniref:Unannotated protein n=2 Tax=freshwater metagenome TaxID=449393 RepID=A0A6J7KDB6_9ZZZZ|nr:MarR family transcriptional regulator [Actinomycetota bacterium]
MTQWLNDQQQVAWRAWIAASNLLDSRLSRELTEGHGLTGADYEILVQLSESDDRWLHMSELADRTLSSRSRLSHQIDRMENAGLVARACCPHDRRGQHAELTDHGLQTLVAAAPTHVDGVRRYVVDAMTPEQFEALGAACATIVAALGDRSAAPS